MKERVDFTFRSAEVRAIFGRVVSICNVPGVTITPEELDAGLHVLHFETSTAVVSIIFTDAETSYSTCCTYVQAPLRFPPYFSRALKEQMRGVVSRVAPVDGDDVVQILEIDELYSKREYASDAEIDEAARHVVNVALALLLLRECFAAYRSAHDAWKHICDAERTGLTEGSWTWALKDLCSI